MRGEVTTTSMASKDNAGNAHEGGHRRSTPRSRDDTAAPSQRGETLHHRILEELRLQIHSGELKPGDALPSEGELMERFRVARGTVRQALAALRAEGAIAGPRGRSPLVRDRRLAQSFTNLISFSAWIASLGMEPSGRLIELALRPAGEECAEALRLPPGALVYDMVRVRYADDEALMIERTAWPQAVGALVAHIDVEHCSIYAELQRQGVIFASAHQVIDALPASSMDARLLQAAPRTPLLRVRRRAFAPDGEPLEWSDDRYLATRVTFTLENTVANAGLIRRLEPVASR